MNDHEAIRELLMLAAADSLEAKESERVMQHVRTCPACSDEVAQWQLLASGLRQYSVIMVHAILGRVTISPTALAVTGRSR